MLLVDTVEKSMIQDVELKLHISQSRPHREWLQEQVIFNFSRSLCFIYTVSQQGICNIIVVY